MNTTKERVILIVEDDKSTRELVRYELEKDGYTNILEAEDGEDAVNVITEKHVDLIVLDLRMPKLQGEDVLRFVKGNHPKIRVVVLTGQTDVQVKQKVLTLGADAYLEKPYDAWELLTTLNRVFQRE